MWRPWRILIQQRLKSLSVVSLLVFYKLKFYPRRDCGQQQTKKKFWGVLRGCFCISLTVKSVIKKTFLWETFQPSPFQQKWIPIEVRHSSHTGSDLSDRWPSPPCCQAPVHILIPHLTASIRERERENSPELDRVNNSVASPLASHSSDGARRL